MNESNASIADWIKANSSVSTVAADLNLSRPTIYKYMDKYDSGDLEKIPPEVISYFDEKLASSTDEDEKLQKRVELEEESLRLNAALANLNGTMNSLIDDRKGLMGALSEYEEKDSVKVADMKAKLDAINKEFVRLSEEVHQVEARISENRRKTAELANAKYIPPASGTFKLKSECYVENGRYMIVHPGEDVKDVLYLADIHVFEQPLYYRLHLYAKIGDEYAHLGLYKPVKDRNFFIIDDVFMSVPLYYNIVTCVADVEFEDWDSLAEGEDPPLQEMSGKECTGLCELKPKK